MSAYNLSIFAITNLETVMDPNSFVFAIQRQWKYMINDIQVQIISLTYLVNEAKPTSMLQLTRQQLVHCQNFPAKTREST